MMMDPDSLDVLFRAARSHSRFGDREVGLGLLEELWTLTSLGPTSANQSPARIVWCMSSGSKQALAAASSGSNGRRIMSAPVVAVIGMDLAFPDQLARLFPHADAAAWFGGDEDLIRESALRNSSLQGAYLILAARALGLDAGPMSGFDKSMVDKAFFAGTRVETNFICALGYGDPGSLFPRLPRLGFEEATRVA